MTSSRRSARKSELDHQDWVEDAPAAERRARADRRASDRRRAASQAAAAKPARERRDGDERRATQSRRAAQTRAAETAPRRRAASGRSTRSRAPPRCRAPASPNAAPCCWSRSCSCSTASSWLQRLVGGGVLRAPLELLLRGAPAALGGDRRGRDAGAVTRRLRLVAPLVAPACRGRAAGARRRARPGRRHGGQRRPPLDLRRRPGPPAQRVRQAGLRDAGRDARVAAAAGAGDAARVRARGGDHDPPRRRPHHARARPGDDAGARRGRHRRARRGRRSPALPLRDGRARSGGDHGADRRRALPSCSASRRSSTLGRTRR